MQTEPPKRKRRWFQFSLRTLFVVTTIVAVQCAVCLPALKEWQSRKRLRMGAALVLTFGGAQSHQLRATQR
jgi:hypothetical protein